MLPKKRRRLAWPTSCRQNFGGRVGCCLTLWIVIYIYTVLIRAGGSFFGTPQLVQSLCPSLSLTKLKTATEFNRVQQSSTVKWNQWCLDKFSLAVIKVLAFAARARLQRNLGARCLLDLVDFFSKNRTHSPFEPGWTNPKPSNSFYVAHLSLAKMTLAVTRPLHDVLETQECSAWFANVGSRTVVQQDCWHCFHLLPTCKLLAGLSIRSHWPMLTYASNLPERKGSVGVQCDGMQWMHWMQHGAAVLFSFFSGVVSLLCDTSLMCFCSFLFWPATASQVGKLGTLQTCSKNLPYILPSCGSF